MRQLHAAGGPGPAARDGTRACMKSIRFWYAWWVWQPGADGTLHALYLALQHAVRLDCCLAT